MNEPYLKCNYPKCKNSVNSVASVTRCSHIFCKNHVILQVDNTPRRCPACKALLEGTYDIYQTNLNISESEEEVMLRGYTPDMIFEAMSKGIQFWEYQKSIESMYNKKVIEHLQYRLHKKDRELETLQLNIKHCVETYEKKIEALNHELQTKTDSLAEYANMLNEKNRQLSKMQSCNESLRVKLMSFVINKDMEKPADIGNSSAYQQNQLFNPEPTTMSSDFVFWPESSRRRRTPQSAVLDASSPTSRPYN